MTDAVAETAGELSELKLDKELKTVLHSSTDFSVVHPLTHSWTMWYLRPPAFKNEPWSELLKEVVTVSSVEEFWGAFNAIPKVTELPRRSDYAFFRSDIRPEWEDSANAKGGKWVFQFKSQDGGDIDEKWISLLLGMIGGTLDDEPPLIEQVNGAFMSVRPGLFRIALWVRSGHEETKAVATRFKETLELSSRDLIEYSALDARASRSKQAITL